MDQEYENILVPMDGSKESELALGRAVAVAKRNGKALYFILPDPPPYEQQGHQLEHSA